MKKELTAALGNLFLAFILLLAFVFVMPVAAHAQQFEPNYVASPRYSNIAVYINHYAIPSYNVNGSMYVDIQDLKNYGFETQWNGDTKSTTIKRGSSNTIYPVTAYMPAVKNIGKIMPYSAFYTTEVKVYAGSKQIEAYGSGGDSIFVKVRDLANINGVSYSWVPEINSAKIWINEGLEMRTTPQYPQLYNGYLSGKWRSNGYENLKTGDYIDDYLGTLKVTFNSNHTGTIKSEYVGFDWHQNFTWEYFDGGPTGIVTYSVSDSGLLFEYTSAGELLWSDYDETQAVWFEKSYY